MSKTGLFKSSIGRKYAMSLSALFLIVYLLIHLSANFVAVFNPDAYNEVAHFMGNNWLVQFIMQPILVLGIIFHFVMGIILETQNRAARPIKYVKNNGSANSTWMSRNMILTGLVILAFFGLHFVDFFFPELNHKYIQPAVADQDADSVRYYQDLMVKFANPARVIAYIVAFVLLGLHLMHGFGSALQSIGQNNKYLSRTMKLGTYYAVIVPLGFIVIAIALYVKATNG